MTRVCCVRVGRGRPRWPRGLDRTVGLVAAGRWRDCLPRAARSPRRNRRPRDRAVACRSRRAPGCAPREPVAPTCRGAGRRGPYPPRGRCSGARPRRPSRGAQCRSYRRPRQTGFAATRPSVRDRRWSPSVTDSRRRRPPSTSPGAVLPAVSIARPPGVRSGWRRALRRADC